MANSEREPLHNTNKATKPLGQVVTEPSPRSATESTIGDSQACRADVERKLQALPGKILGSDHWWNCLALGAAKYWELGPLAAEIKKLARKYGDKPATFQRKLKALRLENLRKLARDPAQKEQLAWYIELQKRVDETSAAMLPPRTDNARPQHSDTLPILPKQLTDRKLQAFVRVLDVLNAPLAGRPPAETNLKNFIDDWGTLAAPPAGRPAKKVYQDGLKILVSGKYNRRPFHHICQELLPGYSKSATSPDGSIHPVSDLEQGKMRKRMKAGIKREAKRQGIKLP
jgi:hypothetical protein